MTIYYSPSTHGFYNDAVNLNIPADKIEITEDQHLSLIAGQAQGETIAVDDKGNVVLIPIPAPTKNQTIALYNIAAQAHLDAVAQSWGYDSMVSAVSYVNSTNAQYKAEAEALIAWRDAYWTEAYTIEAGTLPATSDAFIAELPAAPIKPTV